LLIIENGDEFGVEVGVPLSNVTLYSGEVVRFKDRDTRARCHVVPAADDPYTVTGVGTLLCRH